MAFESLRGALAALSATGEKGFEGLIKEALSQATTTRFRLASSGTQAGTDGDSDGSANCIGYECKLYSSTLPTDSVKTKLLSLQSRHDVDLWLLCTTVTVGAQLAQELREKGADFGLEVQIFDWNTVDGIPRLAVLLALVDASRLESFLVEADVSPAERTGARDELDDFRASPEFPGEANSLSQRLDVPYLSFETARRSNGAWLTAVLSDSNEARYNLDQPIAPLDRSARHPRIFRDALVSQVQTHLSATESPSLLVLTGDEGVGKSWISFDAWLRMDDAPLLLFVPAGRLAAMHGRPSIADIVGTFLAEQVDNKGLPRDLRRWQRTVERWFTGTRPLRLALVVDGINQRPDHDWGFVIGRLAYELGKHDGRTIVSTRPDYYQGVVQSRLPRQPLRLIIPEWTETERDDILAFAVGDSAAKLVSPVAKALRNPRLLSIALTLLGERALRDLREVSIPHLIFEHLRVTARDSSEYVDVRKFREQLKEQAKRIFDATTDGERIALRKLGDLGAAAEGRFLRLVDEDAGLYELSEDGLILALGLALFDRVQAAVEAGTDVNDLMTRLIDPIAAPDVTADVVLAAALAADLRRNDIGETAMAALLVAFVDLQNVSGERLAGFMALARKRPRPFLRAAEKIWLEHPRPFRADWLEGALAQYYSDDDAWPIAICEINRWLRYYSPEYDPGFRHESDEGWEGRAAQGRKELTERIQTLTTSERASLARLIHSSKNVWALSGLAFRLIAGHPLTPFVSALSDWAFSYQLNPMPYAPRIEFDWLGNHNHADWSQMRDLAITAVDAMGADSSRTGLWVQLHMLCFTGDSAAGTQARNIRRHLNETNPEMQSYLRASPQPYVEPLDPDCQISRAKAFEDQQAVIDVKGLYKTFHSGGDDHLRERDLPKLVRMRPDLAIAKGRELIENVLARSGLALRQGLIALRDASLLITPEVAASLVRFRRDRFPALSNDMEDSERKFQSWLFLMLAFPHLGGDAQLRALMDPAVDTSFPIQMMPSFKPPTPGQVESVLDEALSKDSREQCLVAGFLAQIDIQPPRGMAKFIEHLLAGDDRLFGILLLIKHGDLDRISAFARSAWSAKNENHDAIAFFGSLALVEAVRKQLIAADDVAARITVEAWGYLAQSGVEGARTVTGLVDGFIQRASESDVARPVIDIELQARSGYWPRRLHEVSRRELKDDEDIVSPSNFAEELVNHRRRSDEDRSEFLRVMDGLVQNDVELAIQPLLPQDMDAIASTCPETMDKWATSLLDISCERKPLTFTLAIFVASQIAGDDDEKAIALLDYYRTTEPVASVVIGWPEYSPVAKVVWGAGAGGAWRELRRKRLRLAKNDHELFLEAVAAEAEGASAVLLELVDELLDDMHPAHQARGLMLLGFMDASGSSKSRIDAWSDSHGLPGQAHRAALSAWQRNKWARHWFTKMVSADTNEEAWCHQVLFLECVDARIEHWGHGFADGASKHQRLTGGLENTIKNRISRQRDRRMSNLFGSPAPRDEFLRQRGESA